LTRRDLVYLLGGGSPPRFRAVAFDAFAILDPTPILGRAEALFPRRGAALVAAWRARQFEYCWLRALGGRYADFWQITRDALRFSAAALRLALSARGEEELMQAHVELPAWPDAPRALGELHAAGVQLGFLSNFTPDMLRAGVRSAGLGSVMTRLLSTDAVQTYKPDPLAYKLAEDAFGLPRRDILFVAFAGWDAAGAKWCGYPTFWANRLDAPTEELAAKPDAVQSDLAGVARFVAE